VGTNPAGLTIIRDPAISARNLPANLATRTTCVSMRQTLEPCLIFNPWNWEDWRILVHTHWNIRRK